MTRDGSEQNFISATGFTKYSDTGDEVLNLPWFKQTNKKVCLKLKVL